MFPLKKHRRLICAGASFGLLSIVCFGLGILFFGQGPLSVPETTPKESLVQTRLIASDSRLSSTNPSSRDKTQAAEQTITTDTNSHGDPSALALIGIGSIKNGEIPYAVIRTEQDENQRLCHIGDTIAGRKIIQINQNQVLLSINGRNEILWLNRTRDPLQTIVESRMEPPRYTRSVLSEKLGFTADIKEVKQLMSQIVLEKHIENAVPAGVKVIHTQPGSVFEKAGLQADDIIIAVDWKDIESVDDSMEIYESIRSSSKGTLGIIRGGNAITLHYTNE